MLKKLFLSFMFCFSFLFLFSQREKAEKYIALYKDAAIKEMQRSGVPAAITLAQGMLESGFGESELCLKSNNHFGIKCKNEWTGEKTYADDDEKGECFRVYPSAYESYKDHSDFLKSRSWYAFLFKLDVTDYEGWAKGLKKAGYATEKNYPERLISLINSYNLQQYTLAGLKNENKEVKTGLKNTDDESAGNNSNKNDSSIVKIDEEKDEEKEPIDSETVVNPVKTDVKADDVSKKSTYPNGVFTINHAKVLYAKEGTSLLALAQQFNVSLSDLISFNDMEQMDLLDKDRLIFVERKLKKGSKDFYIVQNNETIYDIAQSEGVQLSSLLSYNKIYKTVALKKGDKIFLRPSSKNTK